MAGLIASRATRPKPTPEQQRAADPNCSVWVTASAGTGKTRVLADRVLRLLLSGAEPGRILALTFTKAGASEMVTRIQKDLGRLATWPEPLLIEDLKRLLRSTPRPEQIRRARTLLADVLDLPAGLPVMTIHSFCQTLLQRFPLEAAVPVGFDVLDPRDQTDLMSQALHDVLERGDPELQQTIARLAVVLGEFGLREGLAALNEDRFRLGTASEGHTGQAALLQAIARALDLPDLLEPHALRLAAASDPALDEAALGLAVRGLGAGSREDVKRAQRIADWLDLEPEARADALGEYELAFLTKGKGEPRKHLATAAVSTPALEAALAAEQVRIEAWRKHIRAAAVLERTRIILHVGAAVMDRYADLKQRAGTLDYDDLILSAKILLAEAGVASWVNYKLDRRIDHLLVDESQDTSPEQWAIVLALADEFFAGEGAGNSGRTLFVVGDEKQSIFSFQGANLETFRQVHGEIGARARRACAPWREEPLHRSFRCAPPILAVVDAVFAGEAGEGVVGPAGVRHESAHPNAAGIVEVWPPVPAPEREAGNGGWELPDCQEPSARPEQQLAIAIARQVFEWGRDEIRLPGEKRAIRPGDVMILLPRRGILQDLIIRELKHMGVPVAGADRLALIDELAVMDLMALGDAVLLPEDDLTLAALLRSPLFNLSEDELFTLAYGRGRTSLFARLRTMAESHPRLGEAYRRLRSLMAEADLLPPFEFYARHLAEGGGRKRMEQRLGRAAHEPIEAFLAQAIAYERAHPPSLQGFLQWLRADSSELVRDPDQPRDEVRVLTVHGAKGLEAPIVIIADATFVPEAKDRLLWREEDSLPLWKVGKQGQDPVSRRATEQARKRQLEEQRRLLYVAMTRAQTWLIVAGWERKRQSGATWYDYVQDALERLPATEPLRLPPGVGLEGPGLRFANVPADAVAAQRLPLDAPPPPEPPAPAWLSAPAPAEPAARSPLSPSHLAEEEPPAVPPGQAGNQGLVRGRIVHRLLQTLPDLAVEARAAALDRYLAQPALALALDARQGLRAEILAILEMPGLDDVFGPASRAEVPIVGRLGGDVISGQIDRLAITQQSILLLDYKTDRSPPAEVGDIPRAYLRQLAAYVALLGQLYPGREIQAGLLWTVGPKLVLLDGQDLLHHLPRTLPSAPA